MTKTLEFLFDFASPNAYLSYRPAKEIANARGAKFQITPVLLGGLFKLTGNQAPFVAFGSIPNKMAYEMKEMQRYVSAHGFSKFTMNPFFPINTVQIMRAFIAAQKAGDGDVYADTVLTAMWEGGQNMGDAEIITAVLNNAGLDAASLMSEASSDPIKDALKANTADAAERGAFGVPTFFVGDEMFFGKDRLGQVDQALA